MSFNHDAEAKESVTSTASELDDLERVHQDDGLAERSGLALIHEERILPTIGERKTTSKLELISYYLYYAGNSGLSNFTYGPAILQLVLYMGGFDPDVEPYGSAPCGAGRCYLNFAGRDIPVASVVLDASGIQFALQVFMFILIGAWADYGSWRPWICRCTTVICWAIGLSWLSIKHGSQWSTAVGLNIMSLLSFTVAITYYLAAMPAVARDLPEIRANEKKVLNGEMSPAEHAYKDMLMRNKVADTAYIFASIIPVIIMAGGVGILKAIKPDLSSANNLRGYTVIMAYATGFMILLTLPWLTLEQRRPGQTVPAGSSMFTIGFKNLFQAIKEIRKLKQTLLYLVAYILLSEAEGTALTIIGTLQYSIASYSAETVLYMTMLAYGAQGIGIFLCWVAQVYFKLQTKTLLLANIFFISVACLWGFVGIWTPNFGYKNLWEIWFYQACYGMLIAPWYQLSLTFLSDVIPRSKLWLFWSFFTIWGKSSSFAGPFITSAIIADAKGNENMAFAFLLPVMLIGALLVILVDVKKAAIEGKAYVEQEAKDFYKMDPNATATATSNVVN